MSLKRVTWAAFRAVVSLLGLSLAYQADAMSTGSQAPAVALRCEMATGAEGAETSLVALCQALQKRVARVWPERQVYIVEPGAVPDRAVGVTLVMERIGTQHLRGHLQWHMPERPEGSAAQQSGPSVTFGVQDVPLSAAMYGRFIEAIVQATPDLFEFER